MNFNGKCAIYIGPCTDIGKILLLPTIKEWIMIEELPLLDSVSNTDKRFDKFYLKVKKAFSLIDFTTIHKENNLVWSFHNTKTNTTVWYYHSTDFPKIPEETLLSIKFQCTSVDTIVHSGCFENKYILKLCTNIKFYITSGDSGDSCNDADHLQYELEYGSKCPFDCTECKKFDRGIEMFYLPDFELSNLLFWNTLWNRDVSEYKEAFWSLVERLKTVGLIKINGNKLKEFFETVVLKEHREHQRIIKEFQTLFTGTSVDNNNF